MKLLIKNGTVVRDTAEKMDVLIKDGVISAIESSIDSADEIIDAKGLYVLPGLVDMHVHLREPGYEYKEDIASGAFAAAKGGITAVACMANTKPVLDNALLIKQVIDKGKYAGFAKVYPIGAVTKGLEGQELAEMFEMHEAGAVAFSDDGKPIMNGNIMRNALLYAKNFDGLIISHCEDLNISAGGLVNEGFIATYSGMKGISQAAEESHIAREISIAKSIGGKVHIAHVSTRAGIDYVRWAKRIGVNITCETAPHYFSATDELTVNYDTNAKVNPPLRSADDVEAVIEGLIDGTIDAIACDHAPHHKDEKEVEFALAASGISGLDTSFALTCTELLAKGKIDIVKLVCLMSKRPSEILGIDAGALEVSKAADITLVDLGKKWTPTFENWASKGKNSPFMGKEMLGKAVCTIIDGRIVMTEIGE